MALIGRQKKEIAPGQGCMTMAFRILSWVCLTLSVVTLILAAMGYLGEDTGEAIFAIVVALTFGSFGGCFAVARHSRLVSHAPDKDDEPDSLDRPL